MKSVSVSSVTHHLATHDGHGVDGGVVLLDEELHERGVPLHGGVVEGRPARLRLAVDERVPLQQRFAYLSNVRKDTCSARKIHIAVA